MTTLEKREAIARYADHLASGRGGDLIIPPPVVGGATGEPRRWRFHLAKPEHLNARATSCLRCGMLLLLRESGEGALRTSDPGTWEAAQENCLNLDPPPGKKFIPLAPNEGARR